MKSSRLFLTGIAGVEMALGLCASLPASAHERDHEWEEHHERRREVIYWHQGHWVHDHHEGRMGWWWVVGNTWRFFARPYPEPVQRTVIIEHEPTPQVTVIQQAPAPVPPPVAQTPVMYYCKATGTFYPDTMTCPGGWSTATAGTPPGQ